MPRAEFKVKDKNWLKRLKELQAPARAKVMRQAIETSAKKMVATAVRKAPEESGKLKGSDYVGKVRGTRVLRVKFGFRLRSEYGEIQDTGFNMSTGDRIYPKTAKFLYVPLTPGARGASKSKIKMMKRSRRRGDGGEYMLLPYVRKPRVRRYGSALGPNKYFSGTVKRWEGDKFNKIVSVALRKLLKG